jgi:hypothetical protein
MAAWTISSALTNATGDPNSAIIINLVRWSRPVTLKKRAWHHCFQVLRDQLRDLRDGYIIFEYELPRERAAVPM